MDNAATANGSQEMKNDRAHRILAYLHDQQEEMLAVLRQLVQTETPTAVPDAQQPILQYLSERLTALGMTVRRMPGRVSGGYLMAYPQDREKHRPIQLLLGHCDTVWPLDTLKTMPWAGDNGKVKGPGVYDMKAGLTQILFALQAARALGLPFPYPPVVLINSDEEKGSRDSTPAIRRLAKVAQRAYVLEPPLGLEGKLKTARKGLGRFILTVQGQPAHAGLDPGKGASAILELSYQIQQLFALNDPERGITVNVGMIEGGTSANVVAPTSRAVVDVRVLTQADGEWVAEKIRSLRANTPGTQLTIEGGIGRPPMEKTARNQRLWHAAQQEGSKMGLTLEEGTAGGGSDGNTTSQYTATLDGLGTTGDGAHAHHEFIFSDKLVERTALLTLLLLME
jgi:glutamate carboxypeptidase